MPPRGRCEGDRSHHVDARGPQRPDRLGEAGTCRHDVVDHHDPQSRMAVLARPDCLPRIAPRAARRRENVATMLCATLRRRASRSRPRWSAVRRAWRSRRSAGATCAAEEQLGHPEPAPAERRTRGGHRHHQAAGRAGPIQHRGERRRQRGGEPGAAILLDRPQHPRRDTVEREPAPHLDRSPGRLHDAASDVGLAGRVRTARRARRRARRSPRTRPAGAGPARRRRPRARRSRVPSSREQPGRRDASWRPGSRVRWRIRLRASLGRRLLRRPLLRREHEDARSRSAARRCRA